MKRSGMLVIVKRPGRGPESVFTSLTDVFSLTEATSNAGAACCARRLTAQATTILTAAMTRMRGIIRSDTLLDAARMKLVRCSGDRSHRAIGSLLFRASPIRARGASSVCLSRAPFVMRVVVANVPHVLTAAAIVFDDHRGARNHTFPPDIANDATLDARSGGRHDATDPFFVPGERQPIDKQTCTSCNCREVERPLDCYRAEVVKPFSFGDST